MRVIIVVAFILTCSLLPTVGQEVNDIWAQIDLFRKATTPEAKQLAASVQHAAQHGDLEATKQLAEDVKQSPLGDLPEIPHILQGFEREIQRQQQIVESANHTISQTEPDAWDRPLAEILTGTSQADALHKLIEEDSLQFVPADFQQEVFESFTHEILSATPSSRSLKGLVRDQNSGATLAKVPLKITTRSLDGKFQATLLHTGPDGNFIVDLDKGERLYNLRPGGDIAATSNSNLRAFLLPGTNRWSSVDIQTLQPEEQARLVGLFNAAYQLWIHHITGRIPTTESSEALHALQKNETAILGAAIIDAILGEHQVTLRELLALEVNLAEQLAADPRWQYVFKKEIGSSLEQIVGIHTLNVVRRPIGIAVKTDGSFEASEIRQEIEQLLREITGGTLATNVHVLNEHNGFVFVQVQLPTDIAPTRLSRELSSWAARNGAVALAEAAVARQAQSVIADDPHFSAHGSWGQSYADQWALQRVAGPDGGRQRLDDTASLQTCIVAVLGSGVDWTHPELAGQMWVNMNEVPTDDIDNDGNGFADDLFGWNFRDESPDVIDHGGHDTHVAGVIAAKQNNGRGMAGVNPAARIMALKTAGFAGNSDSIAISRAIYYAVDNGAKVINISYSGTSQSQTERAAIDYALKNNVLVVVPAGNQGSKLPDEALASHSGLLTVAGTTRNDQRARFSNWGSQIDLAAPAVNVLGLRARGTDFLATLIATGTYRVDTAIMGDDHDLYRTSGTSFSAALVSGTASLIRSAHPDLQSAQIRNMLLMSAKDIDAKGWDQNTGAGLINIHGALRADPDRFFSGRITSVTVQQQNGLRVLEVVGQIEGNSVKNVVLQMARSDSPEKEDWITIGHLEYPQDSSFLFSIPAARLEQQRGVWMMQLIVSDSAGESRIARRKLVLQ